MAPAYGRRLMPVVVDELAKSVPDRVFASIPVSTTTLSPGFRDVTFPQIARAVDNTAHFLVERYGVSESFDTLAYMGIPDLRYTIVFLAAVKCGYKVLLTSIRNSAAMNISLLEQTDCNVFVHSPEVAPKVQELQRHKKGGLKAIQIGTLDDLIAKGDNKPFLYRKTFEEAMWDPIVILHSSGSTGPPKPIVMNHGTLSVTDNDRYMPFHNGRKAMNMALFNFECGGRFFSPFPPFHLAGFCSYVVLPIYTTSSTVVLAPAERPPSGQLVGEIMLQFHLRALFCPPIILDMLLREDGALDRCKGLDFIIYAGGPLSGASGRALSAVTDVCQYYGQTEIGPVQAIVPHRDDWAYVEFHPMYGADLQPSIGGSYELVLHHDPNLRGTRGFDYTFPDVKEWHTKDLFKRHPDPMKSHLWRFYGRLDDIVVLSNGEKFNPVPMEALIQQHQLVAGALVVGQSRFQPALLIEPTAFANKEKTPESIVREVWDKVQEANVNAPGHARVIKSLIGVASPNKLFVRAAKGTIIRCMTEKEFNSEIEELYSNQSLNRLTENARLGFQGLKPPFEFEMVKCFVIASLHASSFFAHTETIDEEADFYVLGLDSLQTLEIVSILKAGIEKDNNELDVSWLTGKILYEFPTLGKLSRAIYSVLNNQVAIEGNAQRSQRMADVVARYTHGLPQDPGTVPARSTALTSGLVILLTGSTGSLGSHILSVLLSSPLVARILCFDRSLSARDRLSSSPLTLDVNSPKLSFHVADFGAPRFGLSIVDADALNSVDAIIHSAWKVDFNYSLSSFEAVHVRGIRHIIDISLSSSKQPRVFFVSSLSSVGSWPETLVPVPEKLTQDYTHAQPTGYAESKHVSEKILAAAQAVPVTVLRIGQIAGPITMPGLWNENEWLPTLVKSSKALNAMPQDLPPVDWFPVDVLAKTVEELVCHDLAHSPRLEVYNLTNPQKADWASLSQTLQKHIGGKLVSLADWVTMLENAEREGKVQEVPAVKILPFYRGLDQSKGMTRLIFETEKGRNASKSMRQLAAVKPEWFEKWLGEWGF